MQVYDPLLRVVVISVQAVCIVATFILTFLVFHCRKYKVRHRPQFKHSAPVVTTFGRPTVLKKYIYSGQACHLL